MSSLSRELVFLILQFLDEEKFKETVHKLEQESGFFFNMKYFEDQVQNGEWDEVERYLSGFTKVDDNRYSMKIFFEIRKQKYLEALDKQERARAVEILVKDLKVFSSFNEDLYKEITQLLTLENFRENEQLSKYGDTKSARNIMLLELKKLIEANPLFRDKLLFPALKASRLRTLINQSLNWQHQLCKNPRPNPDIKTLFTDHTCGAPNGARAPPPTNPPLVGGIPKAPGFPPLGAHGPFQPAAGPPPSWINPNPSAHPSVVTGPPAIANNSNPGALLKRPRTPPASTVDYQTGDSEHLLKRARTAGQVIEEVNFPQTIQQPSYTIDDIPKTVARTIQQGSSVASMDFHPVQQIVLLVGTSVGEISIWDVAAREKLSHRAFKVWDITVCSMALQASLVKEPSISVTRVVWSPDGTYIGVAFNKHIVQVYQYFGGMEIRQQCEIDAHVGSVNDLAFAQPNKLCIISCGDDKTIKVFEAATGRNKYTFEGHEAPVYSVCPHHKETIQFIFSTATDGKIKAWLYDSAGSRVDYNAPGNWCTTMAYSADGTRLFSCGTSKDGDSYLVEWNESEGAIKRTYNGFRKRMQGVVQFDTTRNCFLAVGDEFQIKFWDMDNVNLLTSTDAEGGLTAFPRLRFNKDGSLLAVTTNDNGFKILANNEGLRLLRAFEKVAPIDKPVVHPPAAPVVSQAVTLAGGNGVENGTRPRSTDDANKVWKLAEIVEPTQCRPMKVPDTLQPSKICRLMFTNSGTALLALASNAVHKLWKWSRNPLGKATANFAPQMFQPQSGILMTNDITENNPEEAVQCMALSKNDSYVMSASGGKISLFNMMTFKVMTTFMPPPPAATFLAFHPQDNNIIAIGMEDSTIQIYNVRVDEVKCKLKGHSKRITGLTFSCALQVLVSSAADDLLCIWSADKWERRRTLQLQIPPGKAAQTSDTTLQFHNDMTRILVIHETQLAVYDVGKFGRLRQWIPNETFPAPLSGGRISCHGRIVFASFKDGAIGVFEYDTLRAMSRIAPTAYLPQGVSGVYPLVVASHPTEPNLFALGLSDGSVIVMEPNEIDNKWGTIPPLENGNTPAISATSAGPQAGSVQVSDQHSP